MWSLLFWFAQKKNIPTQSFVQLYHRGEDILWGSVLSCDIAAADQSSELHVICLRGVDVCVGLVCDLSVSVSDSERGEVKQARYRQD